MPSDPKEYIYSFKEVDGSIVLDEESRRENLGPSYFEEDEAVENTFWCNEIDAAYKKLRLKHGWTFMGTDARTLREARVSFVGLNPGGGRPEDNYEYEGIWHVPNGNGYFDEKWGSNNSDSTLQRQVKEWHRIIEVNEKESFCANFVPFRSPDWNSLDRKDECLKFAERLWTWVLKVSPATLLVTMGKLPARYLAKLLIAKPIAYLPTGWGRQTIDVWDSPDGRRVIGMPHPSRFALFGRHDCLSDTAEASLRAAAGETGGPRS
jgi:hypothetical protein